MKITKGEIAVFLVILAVALAMTALVHHDKIPCQANPPFYLKWTECL